MPNHHDDDDRGDHDHDHDEQSPAWQLADRVMRVLAVVGAVLLLWLILASLFASGAPAPATHRRDAKTQATRIPERCVMTWRGTPYRASFLAGGVYLARALHSGGLVFEGVWHLDVRTRVLRISERPDGSHEPWAAYQIEMKPCLLEGTFAGDWGVGFVLSPE